MTKAERAARYRERRRLRLASPSAVALAASGVPDAQLDGFHLAVRARLRGYLRDLCGAEGLAETKVMQVRSLVEAELVLEPMSRDVQALTQTGQLWILRSRRAAALLADWLRLKEHRDRLLAAVGLERVAERAPTLADIAEQLQREREQGPELQGATRSHGEHGGPAEEPPQAVESAPGVSEPRQAGQDGALQGPIPGPEPIEAQADQAEVEPAETDVVMVRAAADQAARRVLGTWGMVAEPEPAEMPEF